MTQKTNESNYPDYMVLISNKKENEFKSLCELHNVKFTIRSDKEKASYLSNHYHYVYSEKFQHHPARHLYVNEATKKAVEKHINECELYSFEFSDDKYKLSGYAYKEDDLVFIKSFDKNYSFKDNPPDFKVCNECNKKIDRIKTYILKDLENDKYFQVGGSCAKLYDAEKMVNSFAEFLESARQNSGYSESFYPPVKEFELNPLVITGIIKTYGFISKSQAQSSGYESTSDYVLSLISLASSGDPTNKAIASKKSKEYYLKGLEYSGYESPINFEKDLIELHEQRLNESNYTNHDFYNNIYMSCLSKKPKFSGFYCFAVDYFIKEIKGLHNRSDVNNLKPLDIEIGKTRDIPSVWEVFYKKYYDERALIKCFDKLNNGIQFYIDYKKAEDIEVGNKLKLRAGVKGLNLKKDLMTLTRVKVTKC